MIRRKIDSLYADEPSAKEEVKEVREMEPPRSKHQQFMYHLTNSGRSMAEIQQAWHSYYLGLSDHAKHEVWQEFYEANARNRTLQTPAAAQHVLIPEGPKEPKPVVFVHEEPEPVHSKTDRRSASTIKKEVLKRVRASHNAQIKAKQHLQSLAFGIGLGALVILISLFGLFNELVIAPFVRPSASAATPIILSSEGPAPSSTPEVIIPKINAELPVIYGGRSLAEQEVQKALESGVFHYPTTAVPGQNGNVAVFGHSSNNIFNKGKYKFAFVLLHELKPGDIFYMTYESKVYTYRVYAKKVVNPDETWVLNRVEGKTATATLITCDPPGTVRHRLVVWGEQVSPNPSKNSAAAQPSAALQTQSLPGKGPSVWTRIWSSLNPFD